MLLIICVLALTPSESEDQNRETPRSLLVAPQVQEETPSRSNDINETLFTFRFTHWPPTSEEKDKLQRMHALRSLPQCSSFRMHINEDQQVECLVGIRGSRVESRTIKTQLNEEDPIWDEFFKVFPTLAFVVSSDEVLVVGDIERVDVFEKFIQYLSNRGCTF
jgi:hypothetical protein